MIHFSWFFFNTSNIGWMWLKEILSIKHRSPLIHDLMIDGHTNNQNVSIFDSSSCTSSTWTRSKYANIWFAMFVIKLTIKYWHILIIFMSINHQLMNQQWCIFDWSFLFESYPSNIWCVDSKSKKMDHWCNLHGTSMWQFASVMKRWLT